MVNSTKREVCQLEITEIRVFPLQGTAAGKMVAFASITLEDEFAVHDLRIIEGERGLFVAMPNRRGSDGEYRDLAHPVTAGLRQQIQDSVLEAFKAQQEMHTA